jgi:hypothetical protein
MDTTNTITVQIDDHTYHCMINQEFGRAAFTLSDGTFFDTNGDFFLRILNGTTKASEDVAVGEALLVLQRLSDQMPDFEIGVDEDNMSPETRRSFERTINEADDVDNLDERRPIDFTGSHEVLGSNWE